MPTVYLIYCPLKGADFPMLQMMYSIWNHPSRQFMYGALSPATKRYASRALGAT
jgi:hypothetical protein